jgi:hypothetical protein
MSTQLTVSFLWNSQFFRSFFAGAPGYRKIVHLA